MGMMQKNNNKKPNKIVTIFLKQQFSCQVKN